LMVSSKNGVAGTLVFNLELFIPGNDYSHAISISSLPFSASLDTSMFTSLGDPGPVCGSHSGQRSAWFTFTPSTTVTLTADTFGSNYDTILSAYFGMFSSVACNDDAGGVSQSQISFQATAGTKYSIMVSSFNAVGGLLNFHLDTQPLIPPGKRRGQVTSQ